MYFQMEFCLQNIILQIAKELASVSNLKYYCVLILYCNFLLLPGGLKDRAFTINGNRQIIPAYSNSNFAEATPKVTNQVSCMLENINEAFTPESSFIKSTPNSEYCIRLVKDVELFGAEEKIKVSR